MKILCKIFGHKYFIKKEINYYIRELGCSRCSQCFSMNDEVQCILPMDNELEEVHNMLSE